VKLLELKEAYASGELPKPYFLGAVYAATRPLFEMQQALAGTQIKEIVIRQDRVHIRTVTNDLELVFRPEEVNSLISGLLAFGDTERSEREALLTAAAEARTILDIGANVGWYSLHFSRVAPQARIVAFEPVPVVYDRLLEHLALNGVTQVVTERLALQDKEQTDFLYFHEAETGASSARNNRGFDGTKREAVQTTTLDRYCQAKGLEPELIKCDVEGSEWAVVKGGVETLKRCRPVIFLELLRKWSANFGYHPNDVIKFLKAMGYRTWAIDAGNRLTECAEISDATVATNFLFTHPERHGPLLDKLAVKLTLSPLA
jgi:FkbM family methyltransferase